MLRLAKQTDGDSILLRFVAKLIALSRPLRPLLPQVHLPLELLPDLFGGFDTGDQLGPPCDRFDGVFDDTGGPAELPSASPCRSS